MAGLKGEDAAASQTLSRGSDMVQAGSGRGRGLSLVKCVGGLWAGAKTPPTDDTRAVEHLLDGSERLVCGRLYSDPSNKYLLIAQPRALSFSPSCSSQS